MARLLLLRLAALALAVALLAGSPTGAEAKKRRRRRKKQPKPEVSITRWELCQSCKTVVEEYHAAVAVEIEAKRKVDPKTASEEDLAIDGNKIAREICFSDNYENNYHEWLGYGCQHLLAENFSALIMPFSGTHTRHFGNEKSFVYNHKVEVCMDTGACTPDKFEDDYHEKNTCDACKALCHDIDFLMYREKKLNKKRLYTLMEDLCGDLPARHKDPAWLEEVCDEMLDELEDHVVGTLNLRRRLEKSGLKLTQNMPEKICGELTEYCDDEETAEIKARKEKEEAEREERDKKREAEEKEKEL